jgi:hypothetical protein
MRGREFNPLHRISDIYNQRSAPQLQGSAAIQPEFTDQPCRNSGMACRRLVRAAGLEPALP